MNIRDLLNRLKDSGIPTPQIDLRILLEDIAGIRPVDTVGREDVLLSSEAESKIIDAVNRRCEGEPLGRILGYRDFWKSRFYLSPDTLEPRPDTETLIETAIEESSPRTILDLGTGTGCILLSLLQEFPNAVGTGVDLSHGACDTARANADRLGFSERATFLQGSWFSPIEDGKRFDMIVSNPPYIPSQEIRNLQKEVQNHDPILALDGGNDGLDPYKFLLPNCKNRLEPGGVVLLEFGAGQEDDIVRIAEDSGATLIRLVSDLGGVVRVAKIGFGDK